MKKIILIILSVSLMMLGFSGCSNSESNNNQNSSDTAQSKKGEIAVLYYTFSDTYISSVRTALDKILDESGLKYNDYDANNNQTTQTEQVQTAIAKGASVLVVNVVDTGSDDSAQNIVNLASAQNIPVIFFNRSVNESVVSSYDKCVFVGTDYEMAGHMQGEMIAEYLLNDYQKYDLNSDGKISYVMFKGQEGNLEQLQERSTPFRTVTPLLLRQASQNLNFMTSQIQTAILLTRTETGRLRRQQTIWALFLQSTARQIQIW